VTQDQDAAWGLASAADAAPDARWAEDPEPAGHSASADDAEWAEDSEPVRGPFSAEDVEWDVEWVEDTEPLVANEVLVPVAGEAREAGEMVEFQEELDGDEPGAEPVTAAEAGEAQGTGHPAVDAAMRAVANAAALPVAEQLAAYEGAHETLREVLASIED